MALPPIITNSPLFKVLSGTPSRTAKETAEPAAKAPEDSVKLSDEALRKLEAVEIQSQSKARSAAGEARIDLEQNPTVTLGLDPAAEL
ncbi:MAG: hypothetical protein ACXW30_02135 [Micavibrio sp.]